MDPSSALTNMLPPLERMTQENAAIPNHNTTLGDNTTQTDTPPLADTAPPTDTPNTQGGRKSNIRTRGSASRDAKILAALQGADATKKKTTAANLKATVSLTHTIPLLINYTEST